MKPVRFHPDADAEMVDAAVWYESRQDDLGKRFLIAVQDALNKIEVNPDLYPSVEGDVRRCLTTTFPFGVMFRVKQDVIAVMAIMHLHRDPDIQMKYSVAQLLKEAQRCQP
jgi:ubiquinone biosynthesis protein UbiJ